jgi:hypothetical protein
MTASFEPRIRRMIDDLARNPRVRVDEATLAPPASRAEIDAIERTVGALPPGLADFYAELNGFTLRWEHLVPSIKVNTDADWGLVQIVPLARLFEDNEGITWFGAQPESRRFQPVRPLDLFVAEACAALYQPSAGVIADTVHFHVFGEGDQDTRYTFLEYIDRLLASRGYWYWIQTLCAGLQGSGEVAAFRRNMPLIFDDHDDTLFHPRRP